MQIEARAVAGRMYRFVVMLGGVTRDIGSTMRGVMPPLRSPDGTFGTQRSQAAQRAAERAERYPS